MKAEPTSELGAEQIAQEQRNTVAATEEAVPVKKKKKWVTPVVRQLRAGSAEAGTKPGNDGTGGHTGS